MLRTHNTSLLLTFGVLVAFASTTPRCTHSQVRPKVVRIPDAPTCASCSTTFRLIATLGGRDGPGEIDHFPSAIREDRQGRFWLLPGDNALPRVYSAKGGYVGTVGGQGSGPGEFVGPTALMPLPGDSMLVVDILASRATVISGDLKPRRTMIYPRGIEPEFALDWPRSVMLTGWLSGRSQTGLQFHRASLAGREPVILRSFSPDSSQWRGRSDFAGEMRAVAGGAEFWSYNTFRYRFTRWSLSGTMIADFERDAPWFPRKDRIMQIGNPETPPPPRFVRVMPGDEQRVWSIVNVASPNWKRTWESVGKGSGEILASSIALENLFHTIIEEIDLKSGRVLSRTRTDKWIFAAFDGGRVATYEVDFRGMPRIVIYALLRDR